MSYINSCRNIGKLFEHETAGLTVQAYLEVHGKYNCNETNMCECYSCIFYLIPTNITLKHR